MSHPPRASHQVADKIFRDVREEPVHVLRLSLVAVLWETAGSEMGQAREGLLELARDGDVDAFAALIRECDAGMRAMVFSVVRDRWLMDDVLQLAYEKAFRRIGSFRGDSSFRTWLHRVCWTTAVDVLRAEGRRRHVPLDEAELHPSPDPGPDKGTVSRLTWDEAWSQLSEDQRGALVLVVGEGLSYEEAAAVFGTRPGTVASRVSRARLRLAQLLEEDGPSPRRSPDTSGEARNRTAGQAVQSPENGDLSAAGARSCGAVLEEETQQ